MAFEKIKLTNGEMCQDIKYLQEKNYVGLFGKSVPGNVEYYYKDNDKNAYILKIGMTNPNFETDGYVFNIFAFCIDENIVGISAEQFCTGDFYNNTIENKWVIRNIVYPDGWEKEKYSDFDELLINAFKAMTLYRFDKPESVKKVEVTFDEFKGKWW